MKSLFCTALKWATPFSFLILMQIYLVAGEKEVGLSTIDPSSEKSTTAISSEEWTRFRGPNGTGISRDTNIPAVISKNNILWKFPIEGTGNSSPIVSKGLIIFQSSSADMKSRELYAVTLDGKLKWKKTILGGPARFHKLNTPASSTSAADGKRIYSVFWDGNDQILMAHDYTGKQLWKKDLGTFVSEHGAGISPIVVGDLVILNNDQGNRQRYGPSALQAFDAATGEQKWSSPRKGFRACYSTPFILNRPDLGEQIIVSSTAGVTSYQVKTGKVFWNWDWTFNSEPLRTVASPLFFEDTILAAAGDGGGARSFVALKPNGKKELGSSDVIWQLKKTTPYVPSFLVHQGYAYWVTDKGNHALCVEIKSGKIVWDEVLGSGGTSASPVLINGIIYSVSEDGKIFTFKASPNYEFISKYELGETVFASPAVSDGKLFIRTRSALYCVGNPKR